MSQSIHTNPQFVAFVFVFLYFVVVLLIGFVLSPLCYCMGGDGVGGYGCGGDSDTGWGVGSVSRGKII